MPEQAPVGTPYAYADFREPGPRSAPGEFATFELSSTASVPDALLAAARTEAAAAGFASGWAQGLREARESMAADVEQSARRATALDAERSARMQAALAAIDSAAAALAAASTETAEELEDTVLDLAVELAQALLQREIRLSGTTARDALTRALRQVDSDAPVTVRLSVSDHAALMADSEPHASGQRLITIEPDPSLSPGDAVALCGVTRVDARLMAGLERVKAVLAR